MILNHQQIVEQCTGQENELSIKPFNESLVEAASYDLSVGAQAITTKSKKIIDLEKGKILTLEGGDCGVVITNERLELGARCAARFGLRSKFSRKGLMAAVGPQVDPGYRGKLVIALFNPTPSPITLTYKTPFLTAEFHLLEEPTDNPYNGPYQDREDLCAEDVALVTERDRIPLGEMMEVLNSLAASVRTMKWYLIAFSGVVTVGITIIAVLVALIAIAAID
ncbi:MAG: hypothetical protein J7M08_10295 [Planctomycetes bacterium]|nr:hypothetical protein [Planctomycetota bacterium]